MAWLLVSDVSFSLSDSCVGGNKNDQRKMGRLVLAARKVTLTRIITVYNRKRMHKLSNLDLHELLRLFCCCRIYPEPRLQKRTFSSLKIKSFYNTSQNCWGLCKSHLFRIVMNMKSEKCDLFLFIFFLFFIVMQIS